MSQKIKHYKYNSLEHCDQNMDDAEETGRISWFAYEHNFSCGANIERCSWTFIYLGI